VCYFEQNQNFWVAKHIKKQIRSTTLCLDWHPNNILIAAGGTDFKCRIFGAHVADVDGPKPQSTPWGTDINSADCIIEYSAFNRGWVHSCSFNPSGTLLAYIGHDSTLYVVNTEQSVQT
jgi:actin related protein 2/3 complex subunit 1A/1B